MITAMLHGLVVALAVVLAGCAGPSSESRPGSPDVIASKARFDTRELRQPAVFVRVEVGRGELSDQEAAALSSEYEGLLLDGLNAKAVLTRDVTAVPARQKLDNAAALARAREVGADHALLVDVVVGRGNIAFCRGTRAAFTASTLAVVQRVVVLRASDGAVRWQPDQRLDATAVDPDCDNPRQSRTRSRTETLQAAVDRLLAQLLGGESAR